MRRVQYLFIRRWQRIVLFVGLGCLTIGSGLLWLVGGELCRSANRIVGPPPGDLPLESVAFESQSGSMVQAWYGYQNGSAATVVLVHPLRGDRRTMMSRARLLWDGGFSLLLIDLQGHGETKGENITFGYLEKHDVTAAARFAKATQPQHRIGIIGWSLGGAAAILALPRDVDAMVLESVYPTIDKAVANRLRIRLGSAGTLFSPLFLGQLNPRLGVNRSELRPVDAIASLGCPTLLLAGNEDAHTPAEESQELLHHAREPKELVFFPGAEHVDLFAYDSQLYKQKVISFFTKHLTANVVLERL